MIHLKGKASEMNNSSNMMTKTKAVMMLAHPDTIKHENDVEDLVKCLQMYDICVHDRPEVQFQNWRDFAEKAGEEYKDVVIVLSRGLIELCDIYKSKGRTTSVKIENDTEINLDFNKKNEYKQTYDERWYELLEQRNGEYIPCVALDKIRTVVQDRISEVQIHFVTFCDTTEHFTFNDCEENKPNSISNMSFKHFVDLCPYFKQSQTGHHLKQEQRRSRKQQHLNHHENNGLIHAVKNHACSKSQMTGELESFLKSCDQNYVWEFIKRNTFLQTENTLFHTISRNVLKYLLLSETDNDIDANLLSLISVFKD